MSINHRLQRERRAPGEWNRSSSTYPPQRLTARQTGKVQCCFTSTQTTKRIRDGEPRTATSTFTSSWAKKQKQPCCSWYGWLIQTTPPSGARHIDQKRWSPAHHGNEAQGTLGQGSAPVTKLCVEGPFRWGNAVNEVREQRDAELFPACGCWGEWNPVARSAASPILMKWVYQLTARTQPTSNWMKDKATSQPRSITAANWPIDSLMPKCVRSGHENAWNTNTYKPCRQRTKKWLGSVHNSDRLRTCHQVGISHTHSSSGT